MASPKVNISSILAKTTQAAKSGRIDKEIRATLEDKSLTAAVQIRQELEVAFDQHDITKELKGEKTSTGIFGYGNLKAYFGLSDTKAKSDMEVLKGLLGNFKVKVFKDSSSGKYSVSIKFPSIEEFYNVTPPPQDSYRASWLKALEGGLLQNFSKFLFRERGFPTSNSRSTTGIQTENTISKGVSTVPGLPYITDIFKRVLKNTDDVSGRMVKSIIASLKTKLK